MFRKIKVKALSYFWSFQNYNDLFMTLKIRNVSKMHKLSNLARLDNYQIFILSRLWNFFLKKPSRINEDDVTAYLFIIPFPYTCDNHGVKYSKAFFNAFPFLSYS